ncbi:MAG: hypothetical protein AB7O66_22035 [Limisphaerales bacterium]
MRLLCALFTACAVGLCPSHAQTAGVSIEIMLDETTYLPGEDLPVGVRISNLSGRPLTFGTDNVWLSFYAETKSGDIVPRLGQVPVEGEFTLESAKAGTKWWNVRPYFDFRDSGTHLLFAELRLPFGTERIISEPATFNIQSARKLWEITFGVPPSPDAPDRPPEIRRYALQSAVRTRDRNLYARVTDESETRIYRVVLLDRLLSFSNPRTQLDHLSQLHVLFQTGGSTYTYCVVTPDGEIAVRQKHEIVTDSRPRLMKLEDGSITVGGGRRLPASSDVPPWDPTPAEILAPDASSTAATNAPAASESKSSKRKKRRSE